MTFNAICGIRLGHAPVSEAVAARAEEAARAYFREAEADDFCGNDVESLLMPDWLPASSAWWPTAALAELGLERTPEVDTNVREDIVLTLGVDPHVDELVGLALCYVLHNDGLTFKQGRKGFAPVAGDWFVFQYDRNHEVKESKRHDGVFMGWTVSVRPIQ